MSICPVSRCDHPRHQGWAICRPCSNELRRNLAEAPAIARELEITLARLRSNAPRDGGHASPNRLPYVPEASEATWVLRNTLVGWIRDLEDNPAHHPADTIEAMATWLLGRMNDLLVHPAAQEVVEEIAAAVGRPVTTRPRHMLPAVLGATEAIPWSRGRAKVGEELYDNPAERMFLGRCPTCEAEDIYVEPGALRVECHGCAAEHDVSDLRDVLRTRLTDRLCTASEAASYLFVLGVSRDHQRTRHLIVVWTERKRLFKHAGPEGNLLYRFGEIEARMAERTAMGA